MLYKVSSEEWIDELTDFDPVIVGGKELEVVDSVKLLGVTISSSLSWNLHIDEVIKKASKRLFFLVRVPPNDLVLFYTACIRSIIDYAIPAFYYALPQYLKNELVRLQKRAISIIVPGANYNTGMEVLGILPLGDHHDQLYSTLFNSILSDPNHKIRNLLPPTCSCKTVTT